MTEEEDTLSGRIKRYAHVSTAVSGVAARFIGERLFGLELDHDLQARELAKALGSLKGPVMKVAQMLGTIPDAVPLEYAAEFVHLQSNAPSMGWVFVRRRMSAELGSNWQERFSSFEHEARAAASLGQVHYALSHEGRELACKLQYPDMASIVEADLNQLKFALGLYEKYFKALSTDEIYEEITERLREELDYELEAKHINLYRLLLKDEQQVYIPEVIPELSTKRLLTMTWLSGRPLKDVLDEPQDLRNQIARQMFRIWYIPLYRCGVIHGDPHMGNYTFRDDGSINLLDFGCIRKFHPKFIQGVIDLYHSLQTGDEELGVEAYRTWGFNNLSKEMIEVLNLWAHLLYEPLLDDQVRPIQKEFSGIYGREMAYKVHSELRRLGGIRPPREFVFMDRAAVGVGSVFIHLKAEINWHREFESLIEGFDAEKVGKDQHQALEAVGL